MRRRSILSVAALALAGLATASLPGAALPAASIHATNYKVDGVHSMVVFRVTHLGVSNFYGRFNKVAGSYTFDDHNAANSRFSIEIDTASIDTNSEGRDEHLKGAQFFNAAESPKITFKSSGVKQTGEKKYELKGDLTMNGTTKPVTAYMTWIGARDAGPRFGYRSGFEAVIELKRTDFGMDTYVAEKMLGDEVRIIVAIEGTRDQGGAG